MQGSLKPSTPVGKLTTADATRLHQLLQTARFPDPSGSHLSPAGACAARLLLSA